MSTGGPQGHRAAGSTERISFGQLAEVVKASRRQPPGGAERRLGAILRFVPLMVFSLDARGMITSVSEVGVDMLDTSSLEAVGRNVFDLLRAPRIRRQIQRALSGHQVRCVHPGPPGSYFHTVLDPVFDRAGNLSEVLGVSLDVTETWYARDALRRMRQETRRRIEHGRLLDRVIAARAEGRSHFAVDPRDPIQELLGAAARPRTRRPGTEGATRGEEHPSLNVPPLPT